MINNNNLNNISVSNANNTNLSEPSIVTSVGYVFTNMIIIVFGLALVLENSIISTSLFSFLFKILSLYMSSIK